MRFITRYYTATYVCRRSIVRMEAGERMVSTPLRADFFNHLFDSETAQRQLGWSDEERELVEKNLQSHRDFGNRLYLDRSTTIAQPDAPISSVAEMKEAEAAAASVPDTLGCLFVYPTELGTEMCGKRAVFGGEYCTEHAQLVEVAAVAAVGASSGFDDPAVSGIEDE